MKQNPGLSRLIFNEARKMKRKSEKGKLKVIGVTTEVKEIVMLKVHAKNLGKVAVLCLEGQIVSGGTEILCEAVHSQAAVSGVSAVILDLASVNTVDAHGLGVMLELRQHTEAKGIRFELMN